jgi:adhesin/invasin
MGGLLLPFLASGVALAAGPTSLTVNPTSAYTTSGGSATFDVTLNGGAAVAGSDIYMRTDTGPDAATLGTICTQTSTTLYSCKVTNNAAQPPGTDALRFYYSPTGVYAAGEPTTTASLTIAGAVNQVTLTPTMSSAAQGGYAQYSVSATDAKGQPVPGATVTITATQAGAVNAPGAVGTPQPATDDLFVTGTDPMGATLTPTTAPAVANASATAKTTVITADGTGSTVAGQGKFYVASKVSGTVNLSIAGNTAGTASAAGTLTVNPGGINDVKSVTVSPAAQRAFTTTAGDAETASVVVNLRNAQGNPVSGVTPTVVVTSGPDAGPVAVTGTSDAKGNVTVTYPTSVNSGTDTVEAYVNYTNNNGTTGLDAGEPSGTATVVVAPFNVKSVTASPKTVIVPLSQNAATLTYTVATTDGSSPQGYNVVFSVNPTDTKYTLSAPSAVTDANGKASVTLTNSKPVDGDSPVVTGTVGSATKSQSDSATVKYQASAVTSGNIKITPFANTTAAKGTASFSASATDQFGNPVTGVVYNWSVSGRNNIQNNNGALGTGPTFSYTDVGPSGSQGTDMVTVQATTASGGTVTVNSSDTADQYWVTTNAAATQANIDLGVDGTYTENRAGVPFGQTGPIVPSGFKTTITTGVTNNPTADKPVTPTPVRVKLTDAANNRLYG